MGRMNNAEIDEYFEFEAVPYYIEVYHDKENGLDKRDKMSILSTLKRYQEKYPFSSFLYVESTKSKVVRREKVYTGKPGRPKEVPVGTDVPPHVHIVLIGNQENSVWTCATKIEKAIDKRLKKSGLRGKRTKINGFESNLHAVNYINYSLLQRDVVCTEGDFDFFKFSNIQTCNYLGTFNYGRLD
jgi:hypothetical protein